MFCDDYTELYKAGVAPSSWNGKGLSSLMNMTWRTMPANAKAHFSCSSIPYSTEESAFDLQNIKGT